MVLNLVDTVGAQSVLLFSDEQPVDKVNRLCRPAIRIFLYSRLSGQDLLPDLLPVFPNIGSLSNIRLTFPSIS